MSKVTVYVGLDYHKDFIQVCVMDRSGQILANRRCKNQVQALVELVATFGDEVHAAVESCSGAAALADELATRHRWSINLAHPGYVARMKQTPDKTDWADARVLADLVRVGYLPAVWLAPEDVRQLRAAIIETAHRLVRFDPRWADLGLRLRAAGKPTCVVLAAVANRWVRWLFHQVEGGAITLNTAA